MSCAVCPITVKKALDKVPGVTSAKVDFDKKTASVTFDPDKANPAALTKATSTQGILPLYTTESCMSDAYRQWAVSAPARANSSAVELVEHVCAILRYATIPLEFEDESRSNGGEVL